MTTINSRLLYQLSYRGSRRLIYQSATAANKSPIARHASCREPKSKRQWCARVAKVLVRLDRHAHWRRFSAWVRICTPTRHARHPAGAAWSHCPSGLRNVTNERVLPARLDSDAGLDKDRASRADRAMEPRADDPRQRPRIPQHPGPDHCPMRCSPPCIGRRSTSIRARCWRSPTSCLADLRRVFRTEGRVYIYAANGHGAWEAALVNVLSRGDTVLVLESGLFAAVWGEMAARARRRGRDVPGDWRRAVDPAALEARLRADRDGPDQGRSRGPGRHRLRRGQRHPGDPRRRSMPPGTTRC